MELSDFYSSLLLITFNTSTSINIILLIYFRSYTHHPSWDPAIISFGPTGEMTFPGSHSEDPVLV